MKGTKASNLEEITNILKKHKEELKAKYKIKEIGVFGSWVRGEQNSESDIDIIIEFESGARISLLDFVEIENYLSDLLAAKVDLVEKSALKPRIGKRILNELIIL